MNTPTRFRYYTATTLDGFLADEHDRLDWLLAQDIDEQGYLNIEAFMAGIGALVMGATTYQWVLDHIAATGTPWPYDLPAFVFTHRDLQPITADVRIVAGEPAAWRDEIVAAAGARDVWMVGGGQLAADFAAAGMLDDMLVSYAPVTLGAGRPLFGLPFDFELEAFGRNRAFLCATYKIRGPRK